MPLTTNPERDWHPCSKRWDGKKQLRYFKHILLFKKTKGLIESNPGDRSRSRNPRHPRVRFQSFSDEACTSQRTIEILPEGVWDFSILTCHRCFIIFLTQTSPQFFFLVCIFEDNRITTINEIICNVKETPNHERFKL